MKVPLYDLARLHQSIRAELDDAIDRTLHESAFIGGEVCAFEEEYAAAHGRKAAAGCGSGTDALALALRVLGLGAGDEVVVPSMTFVATAEAVEHVGATPVVADVHPESLLLTPSDVAAVTTSRTRAVVPVHLYGNTVPHAHLQQWRDDGLMVVEDAAQAHLAIDGSDAVGEVGHVSCFSFYPGKNLGALGDGGMVLTDDEALASEVRRLRDHGRSSKFVHDEVGWCSRLDGLQAAVLRVKLRHLRRWTDARREVAERYRKRCDSSMLVPWGESSVHHLLVARVAARDQVRESLARAEIGTGIHYPVPLSRQPWLVRAGAVAAPASERAADEVLSLPMDPYLTTGEVDLVCDSLAAAIDVAGGDKA